MELKLDQLLERGIAAQREGRLQESLRLYRSIIQAEPDHPDANHNLGVLAMALGKTAEALVLFKQALEASPSTEQFWVSYITALINLNRIDSAKQSIEDATQAGTSKERLHELEIQIRLTNVLSAHFRSREFAEAEELANTMVNDYPQYPAPWRLLSAVYRKTGRLPEALAPMQSYVDLSPDDVAGHNNLGNLLQDLGKLSEAEASYQQAIALKPDYAEAHRNLAAIKIFSSRDQHFYQMQAVYHDKNLPEADRSQICFALAKASDDLGDFAKAFEWLEEGNSLRKKQFNYSIEQDIKAFERLKAIQSHMERHALGLAHVSAEIVPVFIVGMPRSGTTLTEQVLSSHASVTGAGELDLVERLGGHLAIGHAQIDQNSLTKFRNQYLGCLKQRSQGNAIVTDKMPQNFRFLSLIAAALPEAKIIHVKRDPAAVCWANYWQYFSARGMAFSFSLDDIVAYHGLYRNLMEYWHRKVPHDIYDFDYETFTENQEVETRRLVDYLELGWSEACLSPQNNKRSVSTASNKQVRQKVFQGSSERWKRYRPFLNGALDHL